MREEGIRANQVVWSKTCPDMENPCLHSMIDRVPVVSRDVCLSGRRGITLGGFPVHFFRFRVHRVKGGAETAERIAALERGAHRQKMDFRR
jgi:hypothetical protein